VSEAARDLAMARFRLIQPYLERRQSLQLVAADAKLSFRTAQRWVSQYRKFGSGAKSEAIGMDGDNGPG
jgi:putative transposase